MKNSRHQVFIKFLLLSFVLFAYFMYLTFKYDLVTGGIASLITWSFFVLCTPIADAGFLLDFPIRLLFGIRMVISEILVWIIAIAINIVSLLYFREFYEITFITQLMEIILTTPSPYWIIIFLSAIGTFLSIRFGDELMDVLHHNERYFYIRHHFKHEILLFAFFLVILFAYYEIFSTLGIELQEG